MTSIKRVYLKVVFINNCFFAPVDVFSLPVMSAIINSLNFKKDRHIQYEYGHCNPATLRSTDEEYAQYELIEFSYHDDSVFKESSSIEMSDRTTPQITASDVCSGSRTEARYLRRRRASPMYTTKTVSRCSSSSLQNFVKDLSFCILRHYDELSAIDPVENRFCYINSTDNMSTVGISQTSIYKDLFDFESFKYDDIHNRCPENNRTDTVTDARVNGNTLGYMKVYSCTSKKAYVSSLNYNNTFNLFNHIIMYFDVTKYAKLYTGQIFKIPFNTQMDVIEQDLASTFVQKATTVAVSANTIETTWSDANAYHESNQQLRDELENLICEEFLPPTPSVFT